MGYTDACEYLESLGVDAMKQLAPSLHRMEAICEALDHPERSVPVLHVTGTNGKTSTARMMAGLLSATGLSAGTFTSPHLQTIRERITMNGDLLTTDEFGDLFDHVRPYVDFVERSLDERLTYFEILSAMFFLWAADATDVAVVEVGLGGRWDATNVADGRIGVITNIGLDHTSLLGEDRETIATEKSGIIKDGMAVVTGEVSPGPLSVIRKVADERSALVAVAERDFGVLENRVAVGGRYLALRTSVRDYEEIFLPVHGSHQAGNAALALEAVTSFVPPGSLDEEVVQDGFAHVHLPGRLEVLRGEEEGAPVVILDVAHNPDGMSAFVSSLHEAVVFERLVVVLGTLSDKDYKGMLAELTRVDCRLIVTAAESPRSLPAAQLRKIADEAGFPCDEAVDVPAALRAAVASAGDGEIVCVTGSHYVVGEARTHLLGPVEPRPV